MKGSSHWSDLSLYWVLSDVSQGKRFYWTTPFLNIYCKNLPDGIQSICKIFTDGTSFLFSKCQDLKKSEQKWAFQWKIKFNPDPKKQENEVISSRKWNPDSFPYPSAKVIENNTSRCSHQKHPGIAIHSKLVFNTHIDQKIQTTRLMKRLLVNLSRSALLAIWKSFIRSRLSYDHILCE